MPGKSAYLEVLILGLIFKATASATFAATAGTATNLYVSLHTADPGNAGTQVSSEVTTAAYGAYNRVAVSRSGAGWVLTGSSISPAAAITFPTTTATGTGCTATYFSIGDAAFPTAGNILYSGIISPAIVIPATTAGVIPQLTAATAVTES